MLLTECGGLVVCHLSLRLQICAKAISRKSQVMYLSQREAPTCLVADQHNHSVGVRRFLASASQARQQLCTCSEGQGQGEARLGHRGRRALDVKAGGGGHRGAQRSITLKTEPAFFEAIAEPATPQGPSVCSLAVAISG